MVAASDFLAPRRMTIEEWGEMDEDEPGEFVDGYLVEEEVPNNDHEVTVTWFICVLSTWAKPLQALVFGSEHKYAVSLTRGRKPDVSMFAPGARLSRRESLTRIPPVLMVEVITPTARDVRRDRIEKLAEYAKFGVRVYIIVDPHNRVLDCYELSAEREYFRAATATAGRVHVPGLEGLVLDLDDLWHDLDVLLEEDPESSAP